MGHPVIVYIYDLTQGMARTMGPAIIGRPLEGVWHTAVVVYGKEYYYGAAGIECCSPGTTMLGQPLKTENLGETQIALSTFTDYLREHSQGRFKGDRYDLLNHNCNNFSNEAGQFLTGKGIPQYILDLPGEIMATPLGQMLAPMIQQMTPTGQSIPFTMGDAIERSDVASYVDAQKQKTSSKFVPHTTCIAFDQALGVEGFKKKITEFNGQQTGDDVLSQNEFNIVVGLANGFVPLTRDNFNISKKMLRWAPEHRFPALDLLRRKCLRPSAENSDVFKDMLDIFVDHMEDGRMAYTTNAMISGRGICNMLFDSTLNKLVLEKLNDIVEKINALLNKATTKNLEIALATVLLNICVIISRQPNLEAGILLLSSLGTVGLEKFSEDEARFRGLVALGTLLHNGSQELLDFAEALEIRKILLDFSKKQDGKISGCSKEILEKLGSKTSEDIGLD